MCGVMKYNRENTMANQKAIIEDASLRATDGRAGAKQVTVSEEYTIEIPEEVREVISVEPGEEVVLIPMKGRIILVPLMPLEELQERLHGIDTSPHPDWDKP